MLVSPESLLANPLIRIAFDRAWQESNPGPAGGHEEGGFIVRDAGGSLSVVRWPRGSQYAILVSLHRECRIEGMDVVCSFHTHPNTGPNAMQEPSKTDRRAVRGDPNLKGPDYVGEFVLSEETIYLVTPVGHARSLGSRRALLESEETL